MFRAPRVGMNTTQKQAISRHGPRFEVFELALSLIRSLRALVTRLDRRDKGLAKQLREAASSIALNLAEGSRRVGKDQPHFYRIAAGSAAESRACLRVAEAWGYLAEDHLAEPLKTLDSILAITWRLTH